MKPPAPKKAPTVIKFCGLSPNSESYQDPERALHKIEHRAIRIDRTFARTVERWKPGEGENEERKSRGLYQWIGTHSHLFFGIPEGEHRVCTEWLRGTKPRDIARCCKVKIRTVERIISDFRKHVRRVMEKGLITNDDYIEYVEIIGGLVELKIGKLRQPIKGENAVYSKEERIARGEAMISELIRRGHGHSVIPLPPLPHRKKFPRRSKIR